MAMDVDDWESLPIRALVHFMYCPRSAALVNLLGCWEENAFTTAGSLLHQRVDSGEMTRTPGLKILRTINVYSKELRLRGIIDALEVRKPPSKPRFLVVETKRSARKSRLTEDVQVCAQSMALEEMTGEAIAEAVIFHAASKRRRIVKLSEALRKQTHEAAASLHQIIREQYVPPPVNDTRCQDCSLNGPCQPADSRHRLQDVLNVLWGDESKLR